MKAKAISFPWRENATAMALGLAIIGFSAGWVHAQAPQPQPQTQIAASQLRAPSDFTCHAKPGTYCDLRDWRGFGQPLSQSNTK